MANDSSSDQRNAPEPPLLERRDGAVVWLTLNRRRAMNALDEALVIALDDRLGELVADDTVGCLVLTGSGRRAFCFGADLEELQGETATARRARLGALLPPYQGVIRRLTEFPVPVIAALNGFATGAGFDLALACDLRLATPQVKLGSVFVSLGLVPDGGSTFLLPRLIGTSRALEFILLGEVIDAGTALDWGLVNRIVEADELENATTELATKLAAAPRSSVTAAKRLLRQAGSGRLEDALAAEAAAQLDCAASEEFAAALRRFKHGRDGKDES